MSDLNEIQPIDNYIIKLLYNARLNYDLHFNPSKPTRGQRLDAAVAMENENGGFYSMEIMIGRKVDENDPLIEIFEITKMGRRPDTDSRTFYNDFAHTYNPRE